MLKKISTLLLGCSISCFITFSGQCSYLQDLPTEITQRILKHLPIKDGVRFMETNKAYNDTFKDDASLWKSYFQRIRGHAYYLGDQEKTAQDYINILKDMKKPKLYFSPYGFSITFISEDGKKLIGNMQQENPKHTFFIMDNEPDTEPTFLPLPEEGNFASPTKLSADGKSILGSNAKAPHLLPILWKLNEEEEYEVHLFSSPDPNNPNKFTITDMDSKGEIFVGNYIAPSILEKPYLKAFRTNRKDPIKYLDPTCDVTASFISGDGNTVGGSIMSSKENKRISTPYKWSPSTGITFFPQIDEDTSYFLYSINETGELIFIESDESGMKVEQAMLMPYEKKRLIKLQEACNPELIINFSESGFTFHFKTDATGTRTFYSKSKVEVNNLSSRSNLYLFEKNKGTKFLTPFLKSLSKEDNRDHIELLSIDNVNAHGTWFFGQAYDNSDNGFRLGYTAYIPAYEDFENEGITFKAEDVPPTIQDGNNTNP
ncbi:MAG: hypothetical protein BGO77_06010 [Caedibacter sp. 37-49]|nr:MAG: hypothetical protein BGO77_06010 [Caedibacter sp. 37-49]